MHYRILGRTGLRVSALAFGAGPVSGLMIGDNAAAQVALLQSLLHHGINWIDTAPGYGQGASETNLGRALRHVDGSALQLASKVRLMVEQLDDVLGAIRRSVVESLQRLGRSKLTLLQLHNGITPERGDEPFSLSPEDILRPGGVLEALQGLRAEGLIQHLGLTATGQPASMREVIHSGGFDTIQVPFNLLNPSAGAVMPPAFAETDYGNIIADCAALNLGVFAIRVFAGGALLGQPPSAHTLKTPFFPLALYERDRARAAELDRNRSTGSALKEVALQFVLRRPDIHAAIIGFGSPEHVTDAATALA